MAQDVVIADSRSLGTYPHGLLYYDGYIYSIQRNDGYHGAVLHRVKADNYNNKQSKVVVGGIWSMAAGLTDIIRIGDYLYITSHRPKLVKVHIPSFTSTLIGLPLNSDAGDCLCNDDTYIYIGHQTFNGKITRVHIDTEENDVFEIGGNAHFHGIAISGNYLYANDDNNGRLYKIDKTTMESVGYATTGICTDDIAQDNDYIYLGREIGGVGLIRVAKSNLAIDTFAPEGMGVSYGVFNIGGIIYHLDKDNNIMWAYDFAKPEMIEWHIHPPAPYDGINELVYDSDGGRLFHATLYDTVGLMAFALGNVTLSEVSKLQVIKVKQGQIIPQPPGNLALSVSNSFVDVVSTKISYRTISQGHSLFTAVLDNIPGVYTNAFDAREPVVIKYKNLQIFKGVLDSGRHVLSQEDKWNLSDYLRLGGRDMSFDLANFKYIRTWPVGQEVVNAIYEMLTATGCDVTITPESSGPIDGYVSIDKYLLDLITEMFEIGRLDGYVDMAKDLIHFELDDLPALPITFNSSNVLSAVPIEFDGLDIKNSIEILGDLKLEEPELADSWTDEGSLDPPPPGEVGPKWEKLIGTTLWEKDSGIINLCIKCSTILSEGAYRASVRLTLPRPIRVGYHDQYKLMDFWHYAPEDLWPDNDYFEVHLISSAGNYFYTTITFPGIVWPFFSENWLHFQLKLGVEETNTAGLPEGMWHPVGNPDWMNITQVEFHGVWNGSHEDDAIILDGLKFTPKRVHYLKENPVSIGKYHKREFLKVMDAATNDDCKAVAESLCAKMSTPVNILQIITPLDTFIIEDAWEGKVGHTVEVELPNVAVGTYRIQDITADITPYVNLKSGFDAIATVNLIPVDAEFYPDSYAAAARPRISSLMKTKANKGVA